jgi:hypothetical protein
MDNFFLGIGLLSLVKKEALYAMLSSAAIQSGIIPDTQSGQTPKVSDFIPDSLSGFIPD